MHAGGQRLVYFHGAQEHYEMIGAAAGNILVLCRPSYFHVSRHCNPPCEYEYRHYCFTPLTMTTSFEFTSRLTVVAPDVARRDVKSVIPGRMFTVKTCGFGVGLFSSTIWSAFTRIEAVLAPLVARRDTSTVLPVGMVIRTPA